MKRAINFAALALVVSCATSSSTCSTPAAYRESVARDPEMRLVDLETLGIPLDIRYATPNNFMKRTLYPSAKAYLRAPPRVPCRTCSASSPRAASGSRCSTLIGRMP